MMTANQRKLIAANLIGTLLEIYDISIYGYFAVIIGSNFFPGESPHSALLNTLAVFMVSFIVRPFGSILFGHLGDTIGRKKTLIITIFLISLATVGIGCLPNTSQIGMVAPLLLILFRIIQGLSFSGEFIGSLIFLMEQAPPGQKAYMASWATCGGNIGLLFASLICWSVSHFCNTAQLATWGWRIPFLFSALGGILCLYLRSHIDETVTLEKTPLKKLPIVELFQAHKKSLLRLIGATCFYMVVCYLFYVWSSTYLIQVAHVHMSMAIGINSAALLLQVLLIPILARWSDKIGRKPLLLFGIIGLSISVYPYYLCLLSGSLGWLIVAHLVLSVIATFFTSILPIMIAEMMPHSIRYSGVGLGYNVAGMLVGGTTPLVAMLLIKMPHGALLLSSYLIFWALVAWVSILFRLPTDSPEHETKAVLIPT